MPFRRTQFTRCQQWEVPGTQISSPWWDLTDVCAEQTWVMDVGVWWTETSAACRVPVLHGTYHPRAFHPFSWNLPSHVHTGAPEILCISEASRSPPFLIVYLKLEDEPHFFFPNVIWVNLHDTRSNKCVLNYVWSPLMGRSLFGKCDLINYWLCFLWQIERHSPTLALHILLIRGR